MKYIRFRVDEFKCKKKKLVVIFTNFEKVYFDSCSLCKYFNKYSQICKKLKHRGYGSPLYSGISKYGILLLGKEKEIK